MSESSQHLNLVRRIRDAIRNHDGITPSLVIAEDHEENTITFSTAEGYRPDVYYSDNSSLILGEAKTSIDLLNRHSAAQFDSYLKHLATMARTLSSVALYVGIPWADVPWARNYFRKIKPDSVSIMIITDFGREEEI